MPRLPLAGLLIALACSATANDLQQVLPANTAADIRQQLQANRHAHFAVVDYARHSSQPRLMLFERNSLRLLKLVNMLLDFARIEAARIQAAYEPINLAAATADLASAFRSAIEKAGLRLVVDCPPLPEVAYVDGEMWE